MNSPLVTLAGILVEVLEIRSADAKQAVSRFVDRLPPAGTVSLSSLWGDLAEVSGVSEEQRAALILYLARRLEALGHVVELPAPLARVPDEYRRALVHRTAVQVSVAAGHHKSLETDATPVLDSTKLTLPDPTRRVATLLVIAGPQLGRSFYVEKDRVVLGRSSEADVMIDDEGVSRRHAEIFVRNGRVTVRDLESTNGIIVNGFGVTEQELEEGDRIHLGTGTILKFLVQDELEERFQKELYRSITIDPLTGTKNRRLLEERLEAECAYARRSNVPVSVLMIDIDHFKRVNDTWGHLAGDAVLRQVGKILEGALRTEDVLGRFGGEEFCAVLRGTNAQQASIVAQRLRVLVENASVDHDTTVLHVTISVGVATGTAETPRGLIEAADRGLYAAKRNGRNRVETG